jgi:hypothetical protein
MMEPFTLLQEPDRVSRPFLLTIALAASAVMAVAVVGSTWLERTWSAAPPPPAQRAPAQIRGTEQTLIEQSERGLSLERAQRAKLESYGWVDRGKGVVHIPIERAIELTLERSR